jgi:hypothetical protein
LTEYGVLGANSAAGTSKAAGTAAKAADVLGKQLGESIANTSSGGSAPGQLKQSSSQEDLMRSNQLALEQAAREHGAMLHVTCVPQAALFIDHRAIARAPADVRLP